MVCPDRIRDFPYNPIWSNYSDLTRPHPKWWFSKGNPLISGKSRLVKYYNLTRSYDLGMGLKPSILLDREGSGCLGQVNKPWIIQLCDDPPGHPNVWHRRVRYERITFLVEDNCPGRKTRGRVWSWQVVVVANRSLQSYLVSVRLWPRQTHTETAASLGIHFSSTPPNKGIYNYITSKTYAHTTPIPPKFPWSMFTP